MKQIPPILRDFPHSFETERLVIRAPLPGDGELLHPAIMESIDRLTSWMPWAKATQTKEETEAIVRQAHVDFLTRTELRLHIFEKESGALISCSGLHRINWEIPKFEIGYWCREGYTGKGYITEAVNGITRFAFEELGARRVEIRCDERNIRSRNVAERAGYTLEGILHHDARGTDQELRNTCIYAMIR